MQYSHYVHKKIVNINGMTPKVLFYLYNTFCTYWVFDNNLLNQIFMYLKYCDDYFIT